MITVNQNECENIFVVSDHHFGHPLLAHNRGFDSIDAHDAALVAAHNSAVDHDDKVFILGDFTLNGCIPYQKNGVWLNTFQDYVSMLNGNLHFVCPNDHHDKRWQKEIDQIGAENVRSLSGHPITILGESELIVVDDGTRHGQRFHLHHYPLESWNASNHGSKHLHGHWHGTGGIQPNGRYCIGIDFCEGFKPMRLSVFLEDNNNE